MALINHVDGLRVALSKEPSQRMSTLPHIAVRGRSALRLIGAKDYSHRNAIIGSTRMARRAGM